ncbi:cache domain-containing sensor histidine kinase [Paenibacillus aceris]|uniref:Two-component system sensor histidine kinase YesM n=1 Tax=Paenibacillus aceris TaxID=869555 RepID=A0ABS4I5H0_9BACL|nr:sensor histidine kinase [Paenibacillus aceris]MBP1966162.1 two-component system sensor histidine kinase YesM [Paenibacillus aceris]NHW33317.1 sensor histidine kinase [Paenibacillus aceris]
MKKISFNLFTKLMLSFLSLVVLPLTVVSYFAYSVATHIINNNLSRSIQQTVHQLSLNSEVILEDAEKAANTAFYDSFNLPNPIKKQIEAYPAASDYEKSQISRSIEDEMNKYTIYRNDINGMYFIDTQGTYFSSANQLREKPNFTDFPWFQTFTESNSADANWSPSHKVGGYTVSSNANVVSFLKKVRNSYGNQIGILWMDVNERTLENIYTTGRVAPNGYTMILDDANNVISISDKTLVTQKLEPTKSLMFEPVFAEDNGYYFTDEDDVRMLVAFATIHTTGWKMISVVPANELFVDASRVKNIIMVSVLIMIVMSTIIAYFLSRRITRPISNLIRLMEKVAEGNMSVRAKVDNSDEIGKLNKHFNIMIGDIQNLISTVFVSNLKQKEAELASLEAQINPHFLYNTLQSIKWLSDIHQAPDIGEMAVSLAKIFRFSIKGTPIVSLYEELQHVKDYISIQKFRYGDRFELETRIPEDILGCQIPKLIIQPLVENAIFHGIETKEEQGTITIWAAVDEQSLHIGVEDDGAEISEEKLEAIRRSLLTSAGKYAEPKKSLGLRNIHERLQMLYGNDYGLQVDRRPDRGFSVVASLPKNME